MSSIDHPRPLLQRAWTTLDGEWDFAFDPVGIDGGPSDVKFDQTILVPFAPETPASGLALKASLTRCWYRRQVATPPPVGGERIVVHFGGVDRQARVYANGELVARHCGGYEAFSADVTEAAKAGSFELAVQVEDDPVGFEFPRGKQEWLEDPHAIWYPRTTGIWQTVWLERQPLTRIQQVELRPSAALMTVGLSCRLEGPALDGARLEVRIRCGDRNLVHDVIRVDDRRLERTYAVGDGGMDDRERNLRWSPQQPNILDVTLRLTNSIGVLDEVDTYTALRDVKVTDGLFLLNGRPLKLRLALDQGYWPETGMTPPDVNALRRDLELTRALGFNGARKHQKVEDPRYLALADRMGMLVWAELPSAYTFTAATAANLLREWTALVEAHRGHPSVVAWVPVNESWGVPALEHDPRQQALVAALASSAIALDGTRPVSSNDGWQTLGGDILGIHDYHQSEEVLRDRYGSRAAIGETLRARRPDGLQHDLQDAPAGNRAVVLSEFGGTALTPGTDAGWGYDRVTTSEELVRRCGELWSVVNESDGLAGACWTQLTDTYQEVNGLLTFDREPKAPIEELRRAITGTRAEG